MVLPNKEIKMVRPVLVFALLFVAIVGVTSQEEDEAPSSSPPSPPSLSPSEAPTESESDSDASSPAPSGSHNSSPPSPEDHSDGNGASAPESSDSADSPEGEAEGPDTDLGGDEDYPTDDLSRLIQS
ncbi:hypothetical protein RchiOBHm_Chr2g0173651 [Rosa chinensis]|uniref:Uncharacterized protein n=1 Tax=Rosa chinensis TaxID=74649 RepID=A0A2P6S5X7_ROSCH|nr:anther-specific protein BCP1 [Rosa chinensis]PRQ54085.1 hypothetical protein RchiOBHm_Chr2g0173651 [Rosa chinensis]